MSAILNVVLFEPEIPPNTGNIIRLCVNVGADLHLIHPMGFYLDEKSLKRSGMDYRAWARVHEYLNYKTFLETVKPTRLFACTTKGATQHTQPTFQKGDTFVFGPESRGLPDNILSQFSDESKLRIPMQPQSRSINLSNSVAVVLYEAWRQLGFDAS